MKKKNLALTILFGFLAIICLVIGFINFPSMWKVLINFVLNVSHANNFDSQIGAVFLHLILVFWMLALGLCLLFKAIDCYKKLNAETKNVK